MFMSNLLFVYGTLKRNYSNHYIIKNCKFKGVGYTLERFKMFNKGYPYIISNTNGYSVKGEIFEINSKNIWHQLDKLEDYPNEYNKKITKICLSSKIINAWIYYYERIDGGNEITNLKYDKKLNIYYIEWTI